MTLCAWSSRPCGGGSFPRSGLPLVSALKLADLLRFLLFDLELAPDGPREPRGLILPSSGQLRVDFVPIGECKKR